MGGVMLNFTLLLLLTRTQRCACAVLFFDAISLSLNKEMAKENQPRGLIPLGTPEREKVAALSLCSSFREVLKIQHLRARVKETRTHPRAKLLEFSACRA